MKNTIVKFSLTALAAFTLAACGSSGGSSDNTAAPSNEQKTQATPSKTNLPTQNSTKANQTVTGSAFVISGQDDKVQVKNVKFNNANINQLEVDGQTITLTYPGIYAGSWQRINNTAVCCGKYANVRMGVSLSNGPTEKDILFYNGAPTQNMPVTGLASYKGDSIILSDDIGDDSDAVAGQSSFDVDFGAKTLSGSITANNVPTINISANISGNSFEGTAKSTKLTDGAVEGKFYGNNAVELGGLAKANDNSWGAGFVGKKQ
ncbi:Slam-dependent surface lipoprotein [uncultured Aggregatibacter sp.]|uniref:Slam-dependent surface lipoprotein n=1 Tax=uncultured Aggregatibacter sp. TaxID=470564 RepID=UPI001A373BFC|nr:Slam-dependent surface lipoprotein [uncultured Aggregatibacter sp.]VTX78281.1 Transferrin-binding protein 2 [uncultured Aggregatibacter sp.]